MRNQRIIVVDQEGEELSSRSLTGYVAGLVFTIIIAPRWVWEAIVQRYPSFERLPGYAIEAFNKWWPFKPASRLVKSSFEHPDVKS